MRPFFSASSSRLISCRPADRRRGYAFQKFYDASEAELPLEAVMTLIRRRPEGQGDQRAGCFGPQAGGQENPDRIAFFDTGHIEPVTSGAAGADQGLDPTFVSPDAK